MSCQANAKIQLPSDRLEAFIQDAAQADSFPTFIAGCFLELNKAAIDAYERLTSIDNKPETPVKEPLGPAPKKRAKPNNVVTTDAFIPPTEVEDSLKSLCGII